MERNYVGQGGYSGNAQSNMISAGRRAGMVRPPSGEDGASTGISPHGLDAGAGSHVPRFGRRASPGSTPTGGGMDMEPPRAPPASRPAPGGIPRGPTGAAAPASGSGSGSGSGSSSGGGASSKLAGLQRLKEASTARLVSRIPSANGSRPSGDTSGYVPSAMTNPQPARNLPARTNSGGRSGGFGAGNAAGGYGSSAGPSSGSARSASTGPALAAAGRPPSGRTTPSGGGAAAAAGSIGYGGSGAKQPSSYGASSSSATAGSSGYGRGGRGSSNGEYGSGSGSSGARQPPQPAPGPSAASASARRQALATAPPPPPSEPQPRPAARAPPPAPKPQHHHDNDADQGYGGSGGGGFGGGGFGGGGFGGGSIPPGAEEDVPAGPMVECPTCGRSFNEQAYSKHAKVCEKVFATKRKPVNMAAKRLEGSEAVKFFDLRKGVPKSEAKPAAAAAGGPGRGAAGRGGGAALDDRPLPGSKVPKWKAQSQQLRAAMAANRQIADAKAMGVDIRDVKLASVPSPPDDRVQCPHCGRKFAELTAERHIPKCKDIMAKPGRLAAGGGRGAHMRR